ncbi:MAG: pyridoxal phosphate-dependent aminotransferase [Candidatus Aminicenantes bacterium]|nr:MAG: pyridoxal phosphate-dependent aminotransferase [Candidatus Aminicenantes bacterium]
MGFISKKVLATPPSATVSIADRVTEMRHQGLAVIDFSAGRAVENTPEDICQVAAQSMLDGDTHQTMAQGKHEYREACAAKLKRDNGIDADPNKSIIATMGIKQGLTLSLLATINPGDEVIVEDPCFVSYRPLIHLCGGIPVDVPLKRENRYRWTQFDLEAAVTDRTKAILFCSPHNPTGTVHTEKDLDIISQVAQKYDLAVLSDEVYERATWGSRKHICIATRPGMKDRTITLMGLTKSYAMGGWRIGFIYAPEETISAMLVIQQHLITCAASFTQTGATKALADTPSSTLKSIWKDWEERCLFAASEINTIPKLSCDTPEGGFYAWIDISRTGETSVEFGERLLEEQQIALIPGSAFGPNGEGFMRMTCVRSWDDLRIGLSRLKKCLI